MFVENYKCVEKYFEELEQAWDYMYNKDTFLGKTGFEPGSSRVMRKQKDPVRNIGINDINPSSAAAPFGGMKMSGMGREGAFEGIDEYLETKLGGFSLK